MLRLAINGLMSNWDVNDVHHRAKGQDGDRGNWRGNLADQTIGRIEARRVQLLLSKIVIPVE
ncbi:hypothetical protein [Paraburkholderia fungorum]|uniref:hypothetical protein n=1 Tax=Paraburkholderia fungorum TaxID=134537 RepID=UPI00115F992E|nr:hypothetical protein [Paraburkholderia fungorum]